MIWRKPFATEIGGSQLGKTMACASRELACTRKRLGASEHVALEMVDMRFL
jgi:hypothetical protein